LPAGDHVADSTPDGWLDPAALIFISLAVLVESDIEVWCLLRSLVLSEIGSPPAHHSGVEDSPDVLKVLGMSDDPQLLGLSPHR
jgi:hypothetical protein